MSLHAIELDDHAELRPERVDLDAADAALDLTRRDAAAAAQRAERTLELALGPRQLGRVLAKCFLERHATRTPAATDRVQRPLIQHPTVVRFGQRPYDTADRRGGGEVEERLGDCRSGQAPVMDQFDPAASVDLDLPPANTLARRRDLDRLGLVLEQPVPPERGGVREHRARAGVEDRSN